jgi:Lrp/AsnC family transcriptional regulator, leucine-responsive regulatory protein
MSRPGICGLDHSKQFPSHAPGNRVVTPDRAADLWSWSHAPRRCLSVSLPTVPEATWGNRLIRMEELDRQIVELLVKDGRMSYTDLGKATGLSTSAVHQRVRRLEQRGVIRGYAAVVDPGAVGLPLTAFISVKPFDPSAPDDIADRLAEIPEIEACHSVAGDENYILKVRVATPLELEHLLTRIRSLSGVSTRTTVVLSTPYEARPPRI